MCSKYVSDTGQLSGGPKPWGYPLCHCAGTVRLVVIGDVHNHWEQDDVKALKHLQPDIALFVGDFGEEVVDLVHSIKQQVDAEGIPAAYVLGNHDAW